MEDAVTEIDRHGARPRVALLRGEALNPFEMQAYRPLRDDFEILAVGRINGNYETDQIGIETQFLRSIAQNKHAGRVWQKARSKNLVRHDADHLFGLEELVGGFDILHAAETAMPLSEQASKITNSGPPKLVLTCWETIPFRFDDDPALSRRKELVRRATSLFIAVTKRAQAALLEEGVAPERVIVVPAAVDCARFHPDAPSDHLRQRWNVPPEATLVLFAGRLIQEKGPTELLRAFSEARSADAYLIFVGNGDQGSRLKIAASALGITEFVRVVPAVTYGEIPAVYASADIVVAPSLPTPYWEEQFGMVLVEAMASGSTLISTSSGAISEVVGDGAVLVPPYDHAALTGALRRLISNDAERLTQGNKARQRATSLFDIPVVAPQISACYRHVLADAPS